MAAHHLFDQLDAIAPEDPSHIATILHQYDTHIAGRAPDQQGRAVMLHAALRLADEPRIDAAPQVSAADLVTFFERMTGRRTADLIAEVRRLQAENEEAREHRIEDQTSMAALFAVIAINLRLPVETPSEEIRSALWVALRERAELGARIEQMKKNAQGTNDVLKATLEELDKVKQDLEDARRMYREDMGRDDDPEPEEGGEGCGAPGCVEGNVKNGLCPICDGLGVFFEG